MEWSKVKNIIILILLAVNALLLVQAVDQEQQYRRYREEAVTGAVEILRRQGYEVDSAVLKEGRRLAPLSAERDKGSEERLAEALLGGVTRTEDGVRAAYQGTEGSGWFRGDGSFSFTFGPEAYRADKGEEGEHGRKLLSKAGYPCEVLEIESEEDSIKVTVRQVWEGVPIFSCTAELTYRDGALAEIAGERLIGTPGLREEPEENMDLSTALIRFMNGMWDGGRVFTRIEAMTAGYQTASAGRRMVLEPVWEVVTDVETMLVDGVTGAMSAAR